MSTSFTTTSQNNDDLLNSLIVEMQKDLEDTAGYYENLIENLVSKISDPSEIEAILKRSIEFSMETTSIKIDLPVFYSTREVIKIKIPEVRMETKKISFDVPAVRMVTKCIAKKPEFYMRGIKLTVKWTCVYADVPETYTKRIEFKTDIPIFNSKIQEIKFDKPVVKMETKEIKFDMPRLIVKDLNEELKKIESIISDISKKMEEDLEKIKEKWYNIIREKTGINLSSSMNENLDEISKNRELVNSTYINAIKTAKATANTLRSQGATEELRLLELEISKLIEDHKKSLKEIDILIEQLRSDELASIDSTEDEDTGIA